MDRPTATALRDLFRASAATGSLVAVTDPGEFARYHWVPDKPRLGAWFFPRATLSPLFLVLIDWRRNGRWYLVVFEADTPSLPRIELHEVVEDPEASLAWLFTAKKRDGRNPERVLRFEALWGSRRLTVPVPANSDELPVFIDTLCAIVNVRTQAEDVDAPLPDATGRGGVATDDEEFPEGRLVARRHLARERNRLLVRRARAFHGLRPGGLRCRVCAFDFAARYGPLGEGFVEMHHVVPLSSLAEATVTRVEDLVPVCANCHRMLHRRRPWLGVDDLRMLLPPSAS